MSLHITETSDDEGMTNRTESGDDQGDIRNDAIDH